MKSALLVPNGFNFEGDCVNSMVFGGQMAFTEQGDKLVVKMSSSGGTCDSAVELSGNKIQFTGCTGSFHIVVYNPANKEEPFKGTLGGRCGYTMKPK